MKITKLGHCCMVIEQADLRILTDPGGWTTAQNDVRNIDIVLITHEHPDHLHVESVKTVLVNNPSAKIYTNSGVGKILKENGIPFELLENWKSATEKGVLIEAFGEEHAYIYKTIPSVINTGYFIANKLFYPGDAFTNPGRPVEILALPVAGPWMHIADALNYAIAIKPKNAFPVHDGMLKITGPFHRIPENTLKPLGINFFVPEEGKEYEF